MSEEELNLDLPEIDAPGGRFRVSPSKIRTFMEDQAQYYFRYIERRKRKFSPAMFEGTTVHRGIEFALEAKQESGELPALSETLDYVQKYWGANHPDSIDGMVVDQDKIIYLASVFEELYPVLETIQPKALETHVQRSHTAFDLHGYVDCIHTDNKSGGTDFAADTDVVIDFKTRRNSPLKDSLGFPTMGNFDLLQLALYGWCLTEAKSDVTGEIIYIVKTRKPKIVRVKQTIPQDVMQKRLQTVSRIVDAMQTGPYLPNYGYWKCKPDRCEFWKECHEKF